MGIPNYTVGTSQFLKARIVDLQIDSINQTETLRIIAESNGFRYKITTAWLNPNDRSVRRPSIVKDDTGAIYEHSALSKFLRLMSANSTTELMGKDVKLAPKLNGTLAIVAY